MNGLKECMLASKEFLFQNPFKEDDHLSLVNRISIVVFHILTAFIPLLAYSLIQKCCPPRAIEPPRPVIAPNDRVRAAVNALRESPDELIQEIMGIVNIPEDFFYFRCFMI